MKTLVKTRICGIIRLFYRRVPACGVLFTAVMLSTAFRANAQTFSEWFRQNSTQKKYLVQQIAALQAYAVILRDGYKIAGSGLGSITGHLDLENTLHSSFYGKLETAGPVVREKPEISEILKWQAAIARSFDQISKVDGLLPTEMQYVTKVGNAVLKDCAAQVSQAQIVITDGKLKMNDQERMRLIGGVHNGMRNNYQFTLSFMNAVRILTLQRLRESRSVGTEKALYTNP